MNQQENALGEEEESICLEILCAIVSIICMKEVGRYGVVEEQDRKLILFRRRDIGEEVADTFTSFMTYYFAVRGNKEGTIMGNKEGWAANFDNEQWMGLLLPLGHFRLKAARQGIKKAHVEVDNQPKTWRQLTWELAKELEGCVVYWRVGGRVMWMGLTLLV